MYAMRLCCAAAYLLALSKRVVSATTCASSSFTVVRVLMLGSWLIGTHLTAPGASLSWDSCAIFAWGEEGPNANSESEPGSGVSVPLGGAVRVVPRSFSFLNFFRVIFSNTFDNACIIFLRRVRRTVRNLRTYFVGEADLCLGSSLNPQ